jgi:nucleotide-binding universal stress UspA family protein
VTVVTQSAKGLEHVGDLFAEAALVSSGRPLIVVPKSGSQEFSVNHVIVAWDGSMHAARAVAVALPIVLQARKVEVVVVGDKALVQSSRARELVSNLERYGLDVELTARNDTDHADTIAREAKSASASLLVMGGYGRSRLREFIFGGVTRHMLRNAKLPVLMAH